jgi:POT family proton-dependent oligopeptide transporter
VLLSPIVVLTRFLVVNFIQRPLPPNSTTGALAAGADFDNDVPGALGMGQRASTGLTLCE